MDAHARGLRRLRPAGAALMLAIGLLAGGRTAYAAEPAPVRLGSAATFAVLAGAPGVTNNGSTVIDGDLGISPAKAVTGFPQGTLNGTIHAADAIALQAQADLVAAYDDAAARTPAVAIAGGALGGTTLAAGIYTAGGVTLDLSGALVLDGGNDPNAVWIFQATSDLVTAASSSVTFINGGQACNVFWQVAGSATLGADSSFAGSILALRAITMHSRVTLSGRALARSGGVILMNDQISYPACFVPEASEPLIVPPIELPKGPVTVALLAVNPAPGAGTTLPPTDVVAAIVDIGSAPAPLILGGLGLCLGIAGLAVGRRWLVARRPR